MWIQAEGANAAFNLDYATELNVAGSGTTWTVNATFADSNPATQAIAGPFADQATAQTELANIVQQLGVRTS